MNGNYKENLKNRGANLKRLLVGGLIIVLWGTLLPILPDSIVRGQTVKDSKLLTSQDLRPLNEKRRVDSKISGTLETVGSRVLSGNSPSTEAESYGMRNGATVQLGVSLEFQTVEHRRKIYPESGSSAVPGTHPVAVFDRFADILMVNSDLKLEQVFDLPGLVRAEIEQPMIVPPPPDVQIKREPSRAVPDAIVRNGYQGLKGKGVIIAIVDSGVDFRHPDFITYDSQGRPTSRLLYLWDTSLAYKEGRGSPAPVTYPTNVPIGTVLNKADLTAELRSGSVSIPSTDRSGHGTACASVAAGNGNADFRDSGLKRKDVFGVAPEADIIAVSFDMYRNAEFTGGFLINAVAGWLDEVAGSRPMVVSNSWGGNYGGHDGQSVMERHLNARFPAGRNGRAMLFAAGNEGDGGFHAVTSLNGGKGETLIKLGIYRGWVDRETKEPNPITLRLYADSTNTDIRVAPSPLAFWVERNPITGQDIGIATFPPLTFEVVLANYSDKRVKLDIYMNPNQGKFLSSHVTTRGTVSSPGAMPSAITVGSYDWNDNFHAGGALSTIYFSICPPEEKVLPVGDISCYSSIGPTRDGRMKPEIGAPGQWFTSSLSSGVIPARLKFTRIDTTGKYRAMNGTSAATPYVAGIVALMFEKDPSLTAGEIKRLLTDSASKDPFTSLKPGPEWGAGKLDFAAVERIMAALEK